jgi:hypothetical protein
MGSPRSDPARDPGEADIQRLFVRADDIAAARRLLTLVAYAENDDDRSGSHVNADAAQQARAPLMLRGRRVEVLGPRFRSEQPFLILLALHGAERQEPQITKTRLMNLSWDTLGNA